MTRKKNAYLPTISDFNRFYCPEGQSPCTQYILSWSVVIGSCKALIWHLLHFSSILRCFADSATLFLSSTFGVVIVVWFRAVRAIWQWIHMFYHMCASLTCSVNLPTKQPLIFLEWLKALTFLTQPFEGMILKFFRPCKYLASPYLASSFDLVQTNNIVSRLVHRELITAQSLPFGFFNAFWDLCSIFSVHTAYFNMT